MFIVEEKIRRGENVTLIQHSTESQSFYQSNKKGTEYLWIKIKKYNNKLSADELNEFDCIVLRASNSQLPKNSLILSYEVFQSYLKVVQDLLE